MQNEGFFWDQSWELVLYTIIQHSFLPLTWLVWHPSVFLPITIYHTTTLFPTRAYPPYAVTYESFPSLYNITH